MRRVQNLSKVVRNVRALPDIGYADLLFASLDLREHGSLVDDPALSYLFAGLPLADGLGNALVPCPSPHIPRELSG